MNTAQQESFYIVLSKDLTPHFLSFIHRPCFDIARGTKWLQEGMWILNNSSPESLLSRDDKQIGLLWWKCHFI